MAFERLSACIEELRAGGSAADVQAQQRKLLRELFSLERRWSPELLTPPATTERKESSDGKAPTARKLSGGNGQLFLLLLQALIVYSGSHTGNSSAGASGSSAMSLGSSAPPPTSESVLRLLCDLLVRAFDYSAVPVVNEALTGKGTSIYVRTALAVVVSKLPLSDAAPFVPEIVAFAHKTIKTADFYMKQCLLASVARLLDNDVARFSVLHPEALRTVSKTFQDKIPEVRLAAAGLLHVLAQHTAVSSSHTSGGSSGASSSSSTSTSNSAGSASGAPSASANGSSSSAVGVTQDAILSIAMKGMDDAAPDVRRAFAAVVGLVLAKFVTSAPDSSDLPSSSAPASDSAVTSGASSSHDDDASRHTSSDHESASHHHSGSGGKSKLAFKMPSVHLGGMTHLNLPGSLSRRKATAMHVSTVASSIAYLRETVTSRYVSASNPNQSHGGILASYALTLTSMLEHLPVDTVAEAQFSDIVDATLSILDHPFALSDLTRARNAVGYVLRYGLYVILTERQREALLGAYLTKLKDEAATADDGHHHKLLAIVVEISHMLQAMGEACVSHAQDAATTLQALLAHEKQSVRFQASVALASLVTALPYKLKSVLTSCISGLRDTAVYLLQTSAGLRTAEATPPTSTGSGGDDVTSDVSSARSLSQLYIVQGRSAAIAHILRAIKLQPDAGLAHSVLSDILALAAELIESQYLEGCTDSVWLTCTRAGWTLVGSLVALNDAHWIDASAQTLLALWLKASVLHTRESSLELLRIEAAVIALHGFLSYCTELTRASDNVEMLAAYILTVYLAATQDRLSNPLKRRGQAARYRVITWLVKAFALLPPIYSDAYIVLLDVIAEATVAQSLTSLKQSPLVPADSTFLTNALARADDVLDVVSTARLVTGDSPSLLYSRELNHVLALLQIENALSDTELEVQYLDNFWSVVCDDAEVHDVYDRGLCSSVTYVRLVDASVFLFGRLFHFVPEELQLRCLQHYASVLADPRVRCDVNVASLLFAAIREAKTASPATTAAVWPQQMQSMLCEMLASEQVTVRRSAGEALGMLAALMPEPSSKALVSEIEKRLNGEKLASGSALSPFSTGADASASVLAAGAAFALACIKRTCGSRISIDTGLLLRFASETAQPLRTWILHAWSIVIASVDATGGDYEQYLKSTSALLDTHLLTGFAYSKANKRALRWHASAKVAIARILNSVVAVLGPDLARSSKRLREYATIWAVLRHDGDLRIEREYLMFLEQVVVFAPARFERTDLVYILSVISDTSLLVSSASASLSPSATSTRASFATVGEQHWQNVLWRVNGTARSVLQQLGLSCIRTLVERDPTLIARERLQSLLFHALHVECDGLTWRYLPRVHGLWDDLTFRAVGPGTSRTSADTIRATILALVDVDAANANAQDLILWSLVCRSIAVGESGAASAHASEQLMMSPKGIDLAGLASSSSSMRRESLAGDDDTNWGFGTSSTAHESDKRAVLASDAIAAQVAVWRETKRVVRDLLATLPPLARQVRHFALECVLRVLALVTTTPALDAALHFDLAASRAHVLAHLSSSTASPDSNSSVNNFVCMYLDEFVTLACHAATASADGSELQMFQSVGLRLLNVLVHAFAQARDPEVPTGDAFVLDPYRAQMTSAIRQALKQASATDAAAIVDVYAPLLIEAYGMCGSAIASRLVQDKVALGRILKMVATDDVGHAQCIGDERTRVTLTLANVACIAQMLASSIALAEAQDDSRRRSVATSPLVKVFVSTFATLSSDVFACWKDVTLSYGVLMRASGQWPRLDDSDNVVGTGVKTSSVLGTLLPVPTLEAPASVSTRSADAFRDVYKRYWPHVLRALVAAHTLLPSVFASDSDWPQLARVLLAFSVFHLHTSARDRFDAPDDVVPVLETLPLLLQSIATEVSTDLVEMYQSSVRALAHAALRSTGDVRIDALNALRACLARETITQCTHLLALRADSASATQEFTAAIVQAALCPLEALRVMCDARPSGTSNSVTTAHLLAAVRCATAGVVVLHTTDAARCHAVDAIGLVAQCYRSVYDRSELQDAVLALSRAAVEATIAFAKTLAPGDGEDADTVAMRDTIRSELQSAASGLVRWLHDELVVARERSVVTGLDFVLRLVNLFAVPHPPAFLVDTIASLHAATLDATVELLRVHVRDSAQRNALAATHVLSGLYALVKKLADAQDVASVRLYCAALGPVLVQLLALHATSASASADTVRELAQTEEWLRLVAAQLDEAFGAAFVQLVLPTLAAVLEMHASGEQSALVRATVAKLLLSFAQTRAAAFKDVVVALEPSRRTVLELALRSALTGGSASTGAAVAQSASGATVGATPGKPLDLSRYG